MCPKEYIDSPSLIDIDSPSQLGFFIRNMLDITNKIETTYTLYPKSKKTLKSKMSKDKHITVIQDTCTINTGSTETYTESPYVSYKIESAHHAVAASLHIMLKHMADMHSLMFEVISEKYKIPYNEMLDALHKDPRIQKMIVEPTLHSLNYFSQEDIDALKTKDHTIDDLSASMGDVTLTPPTKVRKILKKPTIIVDTITETEPKKKIIRKKAVE